MQIPLRKTQQYEIQRDPFRSLCKIRKDLCRSIEFYGPETSWQVDKGFVHKSTKKINHMIYDFNFKEGFDYLGKQHLSKEKKLDSTEKKLVKSQKLNVAIIE